MWGHFFPHAATLKQQEVKEMDYIASTLSNLIHQTAFFNLTWGNYLMIIVHQENHHVKWQETRYTNQALYHKIV